MALNYLSENTKVAYFHTTRDSHILLAGNSKGTSSVTPGSVNEPD